MQVEIDRFVPVPALGGVERLISPGMAQVDDSSLRLESRHRYIQDLAGDLLRVQHVKHRLHLAIKGAQFACRPTDFLETIVYEGLQAVLYGREGGREDKGGDHDSRVRDLARDCYE